MCALYIKQHQKLILASLSVHLPEPGCPNEVEGSDRVYLLQTPNKPENPSFLALLCTGVRDWAPRRKEYRPVIAELKIQILPLIENLEWPYIWGVVCCCLLFVRHRPSVRRSVGRSVGGFEDWRMGDLWGSWGYGRPS